MIILVAVSFPKKRFIVVLTVIESYFSFLTTIIACGINHIKTPRQHYIKSAQGTFLVIQWLRVCATNAQDVGSIPGWETKIPHAVQCGQKIKNVFFKALKKPEPKYA